MDVEISDEQGHLGRGGELVSLFHHLGRLLLNEKGSVEEVRDKGHEVLQKHVTLHIVEHGVTKAQTLHFLDLLSTFPQ